MPVLYLHCLHVCGQSCQANVESITHGEDFLKVCGDHLSLDPKPTIRRNRNAILPTHGHDSPSIIRHYRLQQQEQFTVDQNAQEGLTYYNIHV